MVREQRLEKLGMHASDTALLAFAGVRVPAGALLGEEGKLYGARMACAVCDECLQITAARAT